MQASGPPSGFTARIDRRNGIARIAVRGEIDLLTSPSLREHLALGDGDGGHDVILDLREVIFIDSTGLRAVLDAAREATARGSRFAVVGARPPVRRVFEITGTEAFLNDGEALALMKRFSRAQGEGTEVGSDGG